MILQNLEPLVGLGRINRSNNNLKIQFKQSATAFTAHWDVFIAIGMKQ